MCLLPPPHRHFWNSPNEGGAASGASNEFRISSNEGTAPKTQCSASWESADLSGSTAHNTHDSTGEDFGFRMMPDPSTDPRSIESSGHEDYELDFMDKL